MEDRFYDNGGHPWVVFVLPVPPSVNHYYGNRGNGGKYIKAEGKEFRKVVEDAVMEAEWAFKGPIKGRVRLDVDVHFKDRRRRDIGNLDKCLCDALTVAGVYEDDTLIDEVTYRRKDIVEGGMIVVRVMEIPDPNTIHLIHERAVLEKEARKPSEKSRRRL